MQDLSLIVAFRNEELAIPFLLECLKKQTLDRSKWELILVNDHSSDKGFEKAKEILQSSTINFQLLNLSDTHNGKKDAVKLGVNHAKNNIIIQTDADCTMEADWLEKMSEIKQYTQFKQGLVQMDYSKNNFWSAFSAIEFASLQFITMGSFLSGSAIMASAANLMFNKSWAQKQNLKGKEWLSGDDTFLVHKAKNLEIELNAVVRTKGVSSFKELVNQRMRWGIKSVSYESWSHKFFAGLIAIYSLTQVALLILSPFYPVGAVSALVWILKISIDQEVLSSFLISTNQVKLKSKLWTAHLVYPFYVLFSLLQMLRSSKIEWKGRSLRT